jgi:GntR family transcriptional regulator, transcriptional repressor for pyruvate dehydrogenase complex
MSFKPIQKDSATRKVCDALCKMIAEGEFSCGDRLPPQEELARQLGVSRNTLREAVIQLSAVGLLKSTQGVGTVVERPGPGGYLSGLSSQFLLDTISVREFIEARICIERTAVRLAVEKACIEDILRLRLTFEEQRKAVDRGDIDEFTRQDASFHLAVTELCGNRVLMKFLQTVQDMLHRFIGEVSRLPGAVDEALRYHGRIIEAIGTKNQELAEKEMVLHLFDVVRRIEFNLDTDLNKESICGFSLVCAAQKRSRRSRKS